MNQSVALGGWAPPRRKRIFPSPNRQAAMKVEEAVISRRGATRYSPSLDRRSRASLQ